METITWGESRMNLLNKESDLLDDVFNSMTNLKKELYNIQNAIAILKNSKYVDNMYKIHSMEIIRNKYYSNREKLTKIKQLFEDIKDINVTYK
jgi:hypothetical protein